MSQALLIRDIQFAQYSKLATRNTDTNILSRKDTLKGMFGKTVWLGYQSKSSILFKLSKIKLALQSLNTTDEN